MDPADEFCKPSPVPPAGNVETSKHLVKKGGEVVGKDELGRTELPFAVRKRHDFDSGYSKRHDFDTGHSYKVNPDDKFGRTELPFAVRKQIDFDSGYSKRQDFDSGHSYIVSPDDKLGRTELPFAGRKQIYFDSGYSKRQDFDSGHSYKTGEETSHFTGKVRHDLDTLHKGFQQKDCEAKFGKPSLVAPTGYFGIAEENLFKKGGEVGAKDKTGRGTFNFSGKTESSLRVRDFSMCGKVQELNSAAARGDLDFVRHLVQQNALLYAEDMGTNQALHLAAKGGHLAVVKYLLEKCGQVDEFANQALDFAAKEGHLDFVKCLVENCEQVDKFANRALDLAAQGGHLDVVKYLLEKCGQVDEFANRALHLAAEGGHLDIVKYVVENCGQVDEFGNLALNLAAKGRDLDVVTYLMESGGQVDKEKITLCVVADAKLVDVVKCLVENGAQVNAKDSRGKMALHNAAEAGHVDIVKYLVENGAEVNAKDNSGTVALHYAAEAGHVDIVKYLVENGVEVNAKTFWFDRTALHLAAERGHVDVVKCLTENAAQLDAKDEVEQTALHLAAKTGCVDVVKCLVENGAQLDAKDKFKQTALHLVAETGCVDVVKCLVENGARLDSKDKYKKVPLYLARDDDVVTYLKNKLLDKKINEVRSLAVQFTLANPSCIRVIPYENNGTQSLTVCLYVDTDGNDIPRNVKNAAKEMFFNCEIKYVDLQRRPLSKIVTRLPSCRRQKRKEMFDLSRKIEDNLHVFENRLNVTAVCASYKVTEAVEKDIPCVTVFVLGKGKIPAKETNIHKIKEDNGHLFDNAEFDVVEGYYRPAYGLSPEIEYAFPLRGGVGIGVKGVRCAGTLGGFLEDERGECYILSNDHVLNPPKLKNNTLSSDDGPDLMVDDAGTSCGLKEDVSNTNDDGPDEVVNDAGTSTGLKEDAHNTNDNDPNGVVDDAGKSAGLKEEVDNTNDDCHNGVVDDAGTSAGLKEDINTPNDNGPNGVVDVAGKSTVLKEEVDNTNDDCLNGIVDDAGTSAGLKEDINNPSDNGPNGVADDAETSAGLKDVDYTIDDGLIGVADDAGASAGLKEGINNANDNGPIGVMDDTETSAGLKEDVDNTTDDGLNGVADDDRTSSGLKEDVNNPNDNGPNRVVDDVGIFAELTEEKNRPARKIIEQPAKKDYDRMQKEAKKDHDNIKADYSDVANLSQDDLKNNDEYVKHRLELFEMENLLAQQRLQKIEKGTPRRIGEYVCGLKGNVKMNCDNETYSFYVDAAIARLDKKEVEYITRKKADNETYHCPVYGFNKINNVVPTGEVVDLHTFVKEICSDPNKERKKLTFLKIGRTTGPTDDGQFDTSFGTLFVSFLSFPKEEELLTPAMAHSRLKYCINCRPSDVGEAGLVKDTEHKCSRCNKKLEKSEVYLSWMHNCFAIRCEKPFSEKGDSGSLIFDNHGRAWGLLYAGWFVCNDHAITLASPLTVALNALGKKCGKKLKLWCMKPAVNETKESKCEEPETKKLKKALRMEPSVNETEETKCTEPAMKKPRKALRREPVVTKEKIGNAGNRWRMKPKEEN